MKDILVAIKSVKQQLKNSTTILECTELTENLLSLYVCLELEIERTA